MARRELVRNRRNVVTQSRAEDPDQLADDEPLPGEQPQDPQAARALRAIGRDLREVGHGSYQPIYIGRYELASPPPTPS